MKSIFTFLLTTISICFIFVSCEVDNDHIEDTEESFEINSKSLYQKEVQVFKLFNYTKYPFKLVNYYAAGYVWDTDLKGITTIPPNNGGVQGGGDKKFTSFGNFNLRMVFSIEIPGVVNKPHIVYSVTRNGSSSNEISTAFKIVDNYFSAFGVNSMPLAGRCNSNNINCGFFTENYNYTDETGASKTFTSEIQRYYSSQIDGYNILGSIW